MINDSHQRRSIRLKGYDYTQPGMYFVTLVCKERACLFGEIVDSQMSLSPLGEIVRGEWLKSAEIRGEIELDEFVVMPNHLHGVVCIRGVGADGRPPQPPSSQPPSPVGAHGRAPLPPEPIRRAPGSLGSLIAGFKSAATTRINQQRNAPGIPVWQRNYYEHIVRNETSLDRIRQYILENPLRWALDEENPNRITVR